VEASHLLVVLHTSCHAYITPCAAPAVHHSGGHKPLSQQLRGWPAPDLLLPSASIQAWVKEMAGFVKSIAPNQLIGLGDEGFATFLNDADSSSLVNSNPGIAAQGYCSDRLIAPTCKRPPLQLTVAAVGVNFAPSAGRMMCPKFTWYMADRRLW
jgi:hypothetical protein